MRITKNILFLLILVSFSACTQTIKYGNSKFGKSKVDLEYTNSEFDEKKEVYIDQIKKIKLNTENCALVLIDVWDKDFLSPMVEKFINPLIKDLDSLGFKIIYAPSQEKQHDSLLKVKKGITFYNADTMDAYVKNNDIQNLFYVGFDTFYCVIDKPNGIYSFKNRNKNKELNFFVFDKGVSSYSVGMRDAALRLFKKNNIRVIKAGKVDFDNFNSPKINKHLTSKTVKTLPKGNDLVIIFKNGKDNDTLNDFEDKLKQNNIKFFDVVDNTVFSEDGVLKSDDEFIDHLIHLNIKNIYYAGYHLNNEILWSKFGVTNLYIHKRYMGINKLPKIFFINDLVYIAKTFESDGSLEKLIFLNHYRGIKNIFSDLLINKTKQSLNQQ